MDDDSDDYDFEEFKSKWNQNRKTEFNFDDWCKEIDSHPAFMTSLPESGELSEAAEALQAMKYDEESSLEERAKSHKDDGNAHYAKKKYREAVAAYTEGIKLNCSDVELNANLYNNRSAANFLLANFRSSFKDCLYCRKLKPDYGKPFVRGLECLMKLRLWSQSMKWIEEGDLALNSTNDIVVKRKEIEKNVKIENKEKRKLQLQRAKNKKEKEQLLNAFNERHLKFRDQKLSDEFQIDSLQVSLPQCRNCRVYLNDDNQLVWPVLFMYPEYGTTDFVQEFNENSNFRDHLNVIFEETPNWDENKSYHVNTIEVSFEFERY